MQLIEEQVLGQCYFSVDFRSCVCVCVCVCVCGFGHIVFTTVESELRLEATRVYVMVPRLMLPNCC